MYEDQLYELARKRIDRRNRRWILLGVNFFAFMVYIGIIVMLYSSNVIPRSLGAFGALVWLGVLAMHVFILSATQNRDEAIESEVAKLRDLVYEKPKRLELTDDGELANTDDDTDDNMDDSHNDYLNERPDKRRSNSL